VPACLETALSNVPAVALLSTALYNLACLIFPGNCSCLGCLKLFLVSIRQPAQ